MDVGLIGAVLGGGLAVAGLAVRGYIFLRAQRELLEADREFELHVGLTRFVSVAVVPDPRADRSPSDPPAGSRRFIRARAARSQERTLPREIPTGERAPRDGPSVD
jgi:hypothetical protein